MQSVGRRPQSRSCSMSRRVLVLLTFLFQVSAVVAAPQVKVEPEQAKRYQALADSIEPRALNDTIRILSTSHASRIVGYPGADAAAAFVKRKFEEIGLENIKEEEFNVTVPMVRKPGTLEVNGRS